MKIFISVLLLAVILAGGLCACNGNTTLNTTITPTVKFKIEHVGKWDFSTPPGWNTLPGFTSPSEEGLIDPITFETPRINGEDYLFLNFPASSGDDNSHIFIFDTKDPLNPQLVSIMAPENTTDHGYQVSTTAVDGNMYYGGLFLDKGLWMADISDPAHPKDLGIAPIGMTREIVVSDSYIYGMSQMKYDLPVGYVGTVQDAREVARIATNSRDCQLATGGHLLFTGLDNTLTVYDITEPTAPLKLGVCELALGGGLITDVPYDRGVYDWANWANIFDIKASGNYVYAAFGAGQVRVIDVSDPANPKETATVNTGGFAISLTLKDNRLYLTKSDAESQMMQLSIMDISQPEKPEIMGSAVSETSFGYGGVMFAYLLMSPQVIGDYVYIAGLTYADVFKISDQ